MVGTAPRRSKSEVVRSRLLELIEEGEVGSAIPAERELAAELGVSRMTLRGVVGQLVAAGLLTRRQGSGTYVARPKIDQSLTMTSFSRDMRQRGMVPGSRTLSFERTVAGARTGRWLDLSPQEPIVCARRLRLADAEPMSVETLHVPAVLVPGLTAEDLDAHSFYELLADRYGILLREGTQTIEPTVLDAEEAEVLEAPEHSPAFLFERVTRATDERAVEYVRSLYRGDRYRLVTKLHVPGRNGT